MSSFDNFTNFDFECNCILEWLPILGDPGWGTPFSNCAHNPSNSAKWGLCVNSCGFIGWRHLPRTAARHQQPCETDCFISLMMSCQTVVLDILGRFCGVKLFVWITDQQLSCHLWHIAVDSFRGHTHDWVCGNLVPQVLHVSEVWRTDMTASNLVWVLPTVPASISARRQSWRNLADPASSHMLVSKIKPCMSQYKLLYEETANGSLKQLSFIWWLLANPKP